MLESFQVWRSSKRSSRISIKKSRLQGSIKCWRHIFLEVVFDMDKDHTDMGNLFFILYSGRIWILQGVARQSIHPRYYWTVFFLRRYYHSILCSFQRSTNLSHGFQADNHCAPLLEIEFHLGSSCLLSMGSYIRSVFFKLLSICIN